MIVETCLPVKKISFALAAVSVTVGLVLVIAAQNATSRKIALPTGKTIRLPTPGFIARTNSYPATIAISSDEHHAALLNQGYGTEESGVRQSIAILNLSNNQLRDFPDDRLRGDEKSTLQTYFIGLAFSSDRKHLYASMGSAKVNGIAVYRFEDGSLTPERFIEIAAQPVARGKKVTLATSQVSPGTAPAYPAGFSVLGSKYGDRLLIANNLSDNVILLDVTSGHILQSFDVSAHEYIPAEYPYTTTVNRSGNEAWVSLWNGSAVAELDLKNGTVKRRIELWRPTDPVIPGTHPTSMLLNRNEDTLYVAVANAAIAEADGVAAVSLRRGAPQQCYRAALESNESPGAAAIAIALSGDEKQLYATAASLNAVAVFEIRPADRNSDVCAVQMPAGFIPTEWYPSALAAAGNDLLIASAKGESSGPNNMKARIQTGLHPNPHPYIGTLIGGAIQRLGPGEIGTHLTEYTRQVMDNNLVHAAPAKIAFAGGHNPIRHVIYVLKENRTYDQILGDLGVGDGDRSLTIYGADITPNQHKLALQFGVLDNFYDSGDVSANGHLWSDAFGHVGLH